jgi:hypothetical protein
MTPRRVSGAMGGERGESGRHRPGAQLAPIESNMNRVLFPSIWAVSRVFA